MITEFQLLMVIIMLFCFTIACAMSAYYYGKAAGMKERRLQYEKLSNMPYPYSGEGDCYYSAHAGVYFIRKNGAWTNITSSRQLKPTQEVLSGTKLE